MFVKIIDPSKDTRWSDFISSHKYGSIYHHSAWKEVIQSTYKYTPLYFVLEDDEGRLRAGIPFFLIKSWLTGTRLVSLPFSDVCDPLIDTIENASGLLDAIISAKEKFGASYIEIRTQNNSEVFNAYEMKMQPYYQTHVLTLKDDPEVLRKSFHKSCIQRSIKKAEKSNLTVRKGETVKDMRTFYNLHLLTRKRHGVPPQPYKFFQNIWELMYPRGLVTLLLAESNNRVIAGIVLFKFGDTVYYKYGASEESFLTYRPNHLLMWKSIEMACNEGFRYFDFGRTSADNTGLTDFKSRWGAKEYQLSYLYFPNIKGVASIKENSFKCRIITKLGRKVPTTLLRIGGGVLYKHLG